MSDPSKRFRLPETRSHPPAGASPRGPVPAEQRIEVTVVLRSDPLAEDHPSARRYRAAQEEPVPRRPRLSRRELRDIYSAADEHVERVRTFAGDHGLQMVRTSATRHHVVLEGPIRAMNEAFGVELEEMEHDRGTCRCHSDDIHLPEELQDIVVGVLGLDDVPFGRPLTSVDASQARGMTPVEVARHYNFPAGTTGRGQRIAILSFGGGYHQSDIDDYFRDVLGLVPPVVRDIPVLGGGNHPLPFERLQEMTICFNSGEDPTGKFTPGELALGKATLEATLDIQVAAGVAPDAEIEIYFAPDTPKGWYHAIQDALGIDDGDGDEGDDDDLPVAVSISWGNSEFEWTEAHIDVVQPALEMARLLHVSVCCSSGDFGSLNEPPSPAITSANVNYPAASQHVLACGGTRVERATTAPAGSDTAWNSRTPFGPRATGGGVSGLIPLPTYQAAVPVPSHDQLNGRTWRGSQRPPDFRGRGVPDVAALADVTDGYRVLIGGIPYVAGGTSAATPLWAGLIARLSERLGRRIPWINELVYEPTVQAAFRPVTGGNNQIVETDDIAFFSAAQGWNGCCGLGVPDGEQLAQGIGQVLSP